MTSTTSPYHEDPPAKRFMITLGHYSARIFLPAYVLGGIISVVFMWIAPMPVTVAAVNFAIQVLAVTTIVLRIVVHDRNLCLLDINEAPVLDPQGAIDRNMGRLRFIHTPRLVLSALAAGCLVYVFSNLGPLLPVPLRIADTALVVTFAAAAVYALMCANTHYRLQAWCPWCHGRGFGTDEVPSPEPVPEGSANR